MVALGCGNGLALTSVKAEPAVGGINDLVNRPVTWKKLTYSVPVMLYSATATISLQTIAAAAAKERLLGNKDHALLQPKAKELLELSMISDNFGRRSDVSLIFEPNLQVLQLTHLNSGKRNRLKTYRYLQNGVWIYLQEPKRDEVRLSVDKWTDTSEDLLTFQEQYKGVTFVDNGVLFYLVSVLPLNKVGDKFEFYSFFDHGVYRLKLRVEAKEDLEIDYSIRRGNQETSVFGESQVYRLALSAAPVDAPDADAYELLGLTGDMYLYVDRQSGVLVRLSGDVDYLGRVDISLKQVEY